MDNPAFEEGIDKKEDNIGEVDARGHETKEENMPELVKDMVTLTVPGSETALKLKLSNEVPYDEPDGGEKEDPPDKKSAQKKRISFFHQGNDTLSQDSTEGNDLKRFITEIISF